MKLACLRVGLLFTVFLLCFTAWSQTKRITGRVVSEEDSKPLSGVSVTIKGKGTGTQTDTEGVFALDAAQSDVLVFSYAGYALQEIPVGNSAAVNITLRTGTNKMDEVVVVGYGTQTRRELTGAVATVNPRAFENNPTTNVATVLQGNAPGLRVQQTTGQPGTSPAISFRGGTEFNGSGVPLFVVDGVIVPSLYGLDANDVASIDVLKDAASTAIYGARAANGVVLVTTKKGRRGKTQVTYSFSHTTNFTRPNSSEYLSAADYIRMNRLGIQARFRADSLDNNTNAMNTDRNQLQGAWGWAVNNGWRSPEGLYTTQLLNNQNRHLLNDPKWKLLVDPNPFNVSQMDSLIFTELTAKQREALILQQVNTIEHNVGFSGANEQGAYALSVGSVKDDGIIIGSWLKRLNMNFNGGLNIGKNLKVTSNISAYSVEQGLPYTDPEGGAAGGLMQRFVGVAPTVRYYHDVTGAMLPGPNDVTLGNPLYWSTISTNSTNQQRFLGGLNLEYSLFPFLKLLASGSGYMQYTNNNFFTKSFQQGNGGAINSNRPASFNNTRNIQYTTNAFVQFNKNFNGHAVTALVGGEFYDYKTYVNSGFSQGAPTDLIPWLVASTPPSVQGTTIVNPAGASSNFTAWERIVSGIGRVNYSFRNKYLLEGIVRIDGSSRLKKGNYYGTFPGIKAGWNVHYEDFYQNSGLTRIISSIKPRISYGENGNVNSLGYFGTAQVFAGAGTYNGFGGTYVANYINSDVRWERTNSLNLGADIGFLRDRILVNFDYFIRNVYDKIAGLGISSQTGFGSFTTNLGQLQNKGVEVVVNARIIVPKGEGFALDAGFNYYHVKSYAKKLPFNGLPGNRQGTFQVWDPKKPGQLMQAGGLIEGRRIGLDEVWVPRWDGIYRSQGEIDKDANVYNAFLPYTNKRIKQVGDARWHQVHKNDTIDSRQYVFIGRTTPQHIGGFNIASSFKGFRLYAGFDYALGFVILNNEIVRGLNQVQGSQNSTTEVLDTWTPSNPDAKLPRFYWANHGRNFAVDPSGNSPAEQLWEKGDYVMLRELTLSYDFTSLLGRYFGNRVKGLALNVTGTNLVYFSGYSGNFPEVGGIDQGKYPLPRRLTIGARVTL
jgi:TonB-linked SusC/RagA family outer membrane protein